MNELLYEIILILVKIAIVVGGVMTAVGYLVLLERKMAAWIQDRRGPNRVGIPLTNIRFFGLFQPLADGVKMLFKEAYTPGHVNKIPYLIAPVVIFASAIATMAAFDFGGVVDLSWAGLGEVALQVAPQFDVAVIYLFALSGLAVYGVIVGGWASNNKYSFLGGLRASAQLIAYEIPLGLGILGVVLAGGSLGLTELTLAQASTGVWFIAAQPLGFLVFFVASMAEAARLPFDLPEAEQELVAGYHTEYAGMKLMAFLASEFLHMITAALLITTLFLGGWHFWGLTGSEVTVGWGTALIRVLVFLGKTFAVILLFMLIRWSWPRFRFDQLMDLCWKVMVPVGMVNLLMVAIVAELRRLTFMQQTFGDSLELVLTGAVWAVSLLVLAVVSVLSAREPSRPARNERFIPGTLN